MITTEYQFSETAEDFHALASEFVEQERVMSAERAADYNRGWNDAYGSSYSHDGDSPAYLEGFRDGRRMWKEDCSR